MGRRAQETSAATRIKGDKHRVSIAGLGLQIGEYDKKERDKQISSKLLGYESRPKKFRVLHKTRSEKKLRGGYPGKHLGGDERAKRTGCNTNPKVVPTG